MGRLLSLAAVFAVLVAIVACGDGAAGDREQDPAAAREAQRLAELSAAIDDLQQRVATLETFRDELQVAAGGDLDDLEALVAELDRLAFDLQVGPIARPDPFWCIEIPPSQQSYAFRDLLAGITKGCETPPPATSGAAGG